MTEEELAGLSDDELVAALKPGMARLAADVQMVCMRYPRVSVAVVLTAILAGLLAEVSAEAREDAIEHVAQSIRRRAVL